MIEITILNKPLELTHPERKLVATRSWLNDYVHNYNLIASDEGFPMINEKEALEDLGDPQVVEDVENDN